MSDKIRKSDDDWRKQLTPEQYRIARQKGTERAFTGEYYDSKEPGTYSCICCGTPLFDSDAKFDSGTGWPSFYTAITGSLAKRVDNELVFTRTEYHCAQCLGHQGHVFDDGPKPTGLRFCNDGVALKFVPA